jgi:serine/threonine protein kinase HipA of HipAB toxin-antitoxin module
LQLDAVLPELPHDLQPTEDSDDPVEATTGLDRVGVGAGDQRRRRWAAPRQHPHQVSGRVGVDLETGIPHPGPHPLAG